MNPIAIIILAAGKGSRLQSNGPKALSQFAGKPIVEHIIDSLPKDTPTMLVVSPKDLFAFQKALPEHISYLTQDPPLGTGHALSVNLSHLKQYERILVLCADTPLIPSSIILELMQQSHDTLVCFSPENPQGYGRVRVSRGYATQIIECRDLKRRETLPICNTGIMMLTNRTLEKLSDLSASEATGEYYLTALVSKEAPFKVFLADNKDSTNFLGINTPEDHTRAQEIYNTKAVSRLQKLGVFFHAPSRVIFLGEVNVSGPCEIQADVLFKGKVFIGNHCVIGQGSVLSEVKIGDHTNILPYSIISSSAIGPRAIIGPFAHIQEGSYIGDCSQIGNFVEIKRSKIASNVKVKHLSYLGDATIEKNSNIGAGVITCNFVPWVRGKLNTYIEEGAFIGSSVSLIAPVRIKKGAVVAAGTVLTRSCPPSSLAISRPELHIKPNWAKKPIKA